MGYTPSAGSSHRGKPQAAGSAGLPWRVHAGPACCHGAHNSFRPPSSAAAKEEQPLEDVMVVLQQPEVQVPPEPSQEALQKMQERVKKEANIYQVSSAAAAAAAAAAATAATGTHYC